MEINRMIDHTILNPDATSEEIRRVCEEALQWNFASVVVNSSRIPQVRECLRGSDVKVCAVVGFPLGACTTETKIAETREAVENGAEEIDMVLAIGRMKDGEEDYVREEIRRIVEAAGPGIVVKVILETCLLKKEQIRRACELSREAGAAFVKTSTGFSSSGATEGDVRLMRETVGTSMGVKASGGIRDYETAKRMIMAGANRIGASKSVAIANEWEEKKNSERKGEDGR